MTLYPSVLLRRAITFVPDNHFAFTVLTIAILFFLQAGPSRLAAQTAAAPPDVLVLSNGDTLHGKFVNAIDGKVTFHCDPLGDVVLEWDKIKELHTGGDFAVFDKTVKINGKKGAAKLPTGTIEVANKSLTLHTEGAAAPPPIPVGNAEFIMDKATLDKQLYHHPGFFQGWNGAATAGASLVSATQNSYAFSGAIDLVRTVPTATWLAPRNRTSVDFIGSYGKITQPAYTIPGTGITPPIFVPEVDTKSALYHAAAERDEFLTPRFYLLGQVAFDHNFAQDLALQQIYGAGFGYTFLRTPIQEADVKATIQYEKQEFISGSSGNLNLIGSTIALNYILHRKFVTFTQDLAYIPAFNNADAWSVNETNTLAFPTYKNLAFSVGTLDSYLNYTPLSEPPTKHNSFQFTMGLTYAVKSKY
jgi:Protein of unknown function, DUF481